MHVRVLLPFAHEGRIYQPGIHALTEALAEDAGELVRAGWVIVFLDDDDHTLPLHTPETGQRLTCRESSPA